MLPLRVIQDRNRGGAYLVMLIVGAALFGMFYFVTFFVQGVMGFSALRTGFAFLPVAFVIGITSQAMTKLMPRFGPRPLIIVGTILLTAAMFWYATVDRDATYLGTFLPGLIVMAVGMGCIFVPLTTVAVTKVRNTDAGVASAMLNVGQQVGGSIGLSVLATVAATAGRNSAHTHAADVPKALAGSGLSPQTQGQVGKFLAGSGSSSPDKSAIKDFLKTVSPVERDKASAFFNGPYHEFASTVQAHASGMGFLTAALFGIGAFVIAVVLMNVKKDDVPQEALEGVPVAA